MRHISSKELKERLLNRKIEIGDPIVKVSELRDHGVLLVSPIGKKGYKFPTSEKELAEFYNRLSANVGSRDYGMITVLLGAKYNIKKLFYINICENS